LAVSQIMTIGFIAGFEANPGFVELIAIGSSSANKHGGNSVTEFLSGVLALLKCAMPTGRQGLFLRGGLLWGWTTAEKQNCE